MRLLNFFRSSKKKTPPVSPDPTPARPHIPQPTPDYADPNRTILMFWPNSQSHGWATLLIRLDPSYGDAVHDETAFWEGYVSYLEQTFVQIVTALIALAEGAEGASAFADMEPERSEFRFSRPDPASDMVVLLIRDWTPYRDEGDHAVWDDSLPWEDFGSARPVALRHLIDDVVWLAEEAEARFGADSYRAAWGSSLPKDGLQRLRDLRSEMGGYGPGLGLNLRP